MENVQCMNKNFPDMTEHDSHSVIQGKSNSF